MYTTNSLRHLAWAVLGLVTQQVFSQATQDNNTGGAGSFLGWDAGANQILEVKNEANKPVEWYTNDIGRMRLSEDVTSAMGPLNEFPGVNRDGYLLLSGTPDALTNAGSRAPFTRLHLVDQIVSAGPNNYAQQQGFRPWQRNGLTLTGNNDQSYFGHRYDDVDNTDLVIQWSDNPDSSPWGTDRMKFVFTTLYNAGATRGAATMNGLEAMRLFPATYSEVNVGIGDFAQTGLAEPDPTERVDVLDRTIRLRRLIPDYNNDTISRVVMVDTTGRLHWRRINTWPSTGTGTADCKWTLLGTGNANIATAYTGNPGCPQETRNVGIGTASPSAKLHVERILASSSGLQRAGLFNMDGSNATGNKIGVQAIATGTGQENIGVKGESKGGGTTNYGLHGEATGTGTATSPDTGTRYGIYGAAIQGAKRSYGARAVGGWATQMTCGVRAHGDHGPSGIAKPDSIFGVWASSGNSIRRSYGVYASTGLAAGVDGTTGNSYGVYCESGAAVGNSTPPQQVSYALYAKRTYPGASHPNNWAGWFEGNVMINGNGYLTGMVPITSDGNLKTNVEELEDADSLLSLLAPKRYEFLTEQFPDLALAEGEQWGFIAQDVEEVMPDLVHKVTVPAFHDSLGNQTQAAMELRTLNYIGMIPLLVAGYQEQRATIVQQQADNAAQAANLDALRSRLDQLETALASCCANSMGGEQRATGTSGNVDAVSGNERALTIQPNPFNETTTLYYTLERSGRMQLMANSADGKQLRVLQEANMEAGQYQLEWNTTDLSPGMYYVMLMLDGEPIVKKAVKVQR